MSAVRMVCETFQELLGLVEENMPRSAPFGEGSKSYSQEERLVMVIFWRDMINTERHGKHRRLSDLASPGSMISNTGDVCITL